MNTSTTSKPTTYAKQHITTTKTTTSNTQKITTKHKHIYIYI